ncbi:MTH1187 family thiamine-binding protein [Candidatus Bipolaricaulota bacterium]|nr:MTH1187 family thiamine-binding protein [Candidatus Bipolaricaulota bacterium]
MIVDFTIFPTDAGESVSAYVAEVFKIIEESGLKYEHHAMGTNIEGDWDEVMAVIKACRKRMLENSNRISIGIRIDERKGVTDGIRKKVASAKAKMNAASAELGIRNAE